MNGFKRDRVNGSKNTARDMLEYVERVIATRDYQALWDLHCATMAGFGFDRLIYAFNRFARKDNVGDPDDYFILSSHDPAYTDTYVYGGICRDSPMFDWEFSGSGARSWRRVHEIPGGLTEAQQRVLDFNAQHDVTAGYSISLGCPNGRGIAIFSLTARRGLDQDAVDAIWDDHGREIFAMSNIAHMRLSRLPLPVARTLTDRQREVLEWVGEGKSTLDIAQIMGVAPATVEKHLRLAREALGAHTTAQAVLRAAFFNKIYLAR